VKRARCWDSNEEKWDVNAPGFPATQVDLDVTEGTWMSLDVSPKGDEIVFDLLGDLYSLPMTGGEAKALTSGVAWDMQPRYSPDGERFSWGALGLVATIQRGRVGRGLRVSPP
jgi:hypothetical protein